MRENQKRDTVEYEVIDDFLNEEYFDSLVTLIFNDTPWFLTNAIAKKDIIENKIFMLMHMFYHNNTPTNPLYEKIIPLLKKLKVECLLRVKANLYPNTEIVHEHPPHTDYDFSHTGAILSLNTCDGYTKLKDGTKIESVANRLLIFDASEEHCSTTTTNVFARINININHIQTQQKLQYG